MVFPPFFDVANAVGAATGVVAQTVTVTVEGDGSGLFRVHGSGRGQQSSPPARRRWRPRKTRRGSWRTAAVRQLGADQIRRCRSRISKSHLPDAVDDNGMLEAVVRAEAIGRPSTA